MLIALAYLPCMHLETIFRHFSDIFTAIYTCDDT